MKNERIIINQLKEDIESEIHEALENLLNPNCDFVEFHRGELSGLNRALWMLEGKPKD